MSDSEATDPRLDKVIVRCHAALGAIKQRIDEVRASSESQNLALGGALVDRDRKIGELEATVSSLRETPTSAGDGAATTGSDETASAGGKLDPESIRASRTFRELARERDALALQVAELESARTRDKAEVSSIMAAIQSVLEADPDA